MARPERWLLDKIIDKVANKVGDGINESKRVNLNQDREPIRSHAKMRIIGRIRPIIEGTNLGANQSIG